MVYLLKVPALEWEPDAASAPISHRRLASIAYRTYTLRIKLIAMPGYAGISQVCLLYWQPRVYPHILDL